MYSNSLKDCVEYIHCQILDSKKEDVLGLFWGELGKCYFEFLYADYHQYSFNHAMERYVDICLCISDVDKIDESFLLSCSELGLFTYQLVSSGLLDEEYSFEIPCEVELFMEKSLYQCVKASNYNIFYGALNFASYFYYAYKTTGRTEYRTILENFVETLKRKAVIINENEIGWTGKMSARYLKEDGYNFTYIHGINSIIVFLNKLYGLGIKTDLCRDLIQRACNFEVRYKLSLHSHSEIQFPVGVYQSLQAVPGRVPVINLNAGELMIGYVLSLSGDTIEDTSLQCIGQQTVSGSNFGIDHMYPEIKDRGILSGYSGLALLYKKLYELKRDAAYQKRYIRLLFHEAADLSLKKEEKPDYSFMSGLTGIGCCMLNQVSENTRLNVETLLL